MDRLWAPWRIGYVANADKEETCFLCDAARDPGHDHEHLVIRRGELAFAILNRYPYNNGHAMVAPYAHKADLPELGEAEQAELFAMVLDVQAALRARLSPHGFNIGINIGTAAGAGIPGHVHVHILPRWNGDTNFVTTCSDVKVISQSLEDAYAELTAYFEETADPP
ncbi:MAG: HIT domain-containing protein [Planctomycetota bacterium]